MNPTVSYSSRPFTTCLAQVNHISSLTDQSPRLICSLQKSWNHQSQSSLHTLNRAKVSDTPSIRTRCNGNRLLRLASNSSPMQPPSLCTKRVQYVTPFRILKTPFRTYHSDLHAPPLPTHEYTNSQTAILTAALEHVPTHGFTKEALTLGARDSGFLDVSVQLLTRQEMDLILFWLASRRGLIRAQVESGLFSEEQQQANLANTVRNKELVVEDKVRTLVLERLRMNKSIIHKWQDALAVMSFPKNVPLALSELYALSSDILYLSGDKTVDASWYTKRLSLATIYASAEVVMTQDQSTDPEFAATEAFVNHRIHDNHIIGESIAGTKRYLGFLATSAIGVGRSWGLKI